MSKDRPAAAPERNRATTSDVPPSDSTAPSAALIGSDLLALCTDIEAKLDDDTFYLRERPDDIRLLTKAARQNVRLKELLQQAQSLCSTHLFDDIAEELGEPK